MLCLVTGLFIRSWEGTVSRMLNLLSVSHVSGPLLFDIVANGMLQLEEDGSEPQQKDGSKPLTRVHVRVDSKVRDVEHGNARSTGQFNYTFSVSHFGSTF